MFFILSKTLNYLTMPFVVVCLLFLISVLVRNKSKWKKRFFWAGFSLLFFFSNPFIANEVMKVWEPDVILYSEVKPYQLGILLTGVTSVDRMPEDRVHFKMGADRVTHTLQLYRLGIIKKILVSGRNGKLIDNKKSEADDTKQVLIMMGVPPEDIMTEEVSRNTHESAVEVEKILQARNIDPSDCLLITSAFHIPRSLACYRKLNLGVTGFPTDFYTYPRKFSLDFLIIPSIEAFFVWNKLIREWVGFIAYKLVGYV